MSALNEATNTRVGTALSASLASPEVTKRAYEDVQALARTIQQARGSFALVSTALTWWDIVGLRDPQGHPVVLGAKWRDLINNFEAALKASIQIAPSAAATMKTVDDLLGSAPGKKQGELKTRLQAFMQEVKVKEKEALEMKNQFQNVVDQVRIFWAEVERALAIPIVDAVRRVALNAIHQRLSELSKQLESLQQKLVALETTAVSQVASGGSGAVAIMLALCPNAFMIALETAFEDGNLFTDIKKQQQVLEDEVAATKAKIGGVLVEQIALQLYQHVLENPKDFIDYTALKLDTIVNIWQTINLDMHALYTDLSMSMADDAPVTVFLLSKMKVTKDIYGKLAWLLEQYVDAMKSI